MEEYPEEPDAEFERWCNDNARDAQLEYDCKVCINHIKQCTANLQIHLANVFNSLPDRSTQDASEIKSASEEAEKMLADIGTDTGSGASDGGQPHPGEDKKQAELLHNISEFAQREHKWVIDEYTHLSKMFRNIEAGKYEGNDSELRYAARSAKNMLSLQHRLDKELLIWVSHLETEKRGEVKEIAENLRILTDFLVKHTSRYHGDLAVSYRKFTDQRKAIESLIEKGAIDKIKQDIKSWKNFDDTKKKQLSDYYEERKKAADDKKLEAEAKLESLKKELVALLQDILKKISGTLILLEMLKNPKNPILPKQMGAKNVRKAR